MKIIFKRQNDVNYPWSCTIEYSSCNRKTIELSGSFASAYDQVAAWIDDYQVHFTYDLVTAIRNASIITYELRIDDQVIDITDPVNLALAILTYD